MNLRLVSRHLAIIAWLVAVAMAFSLPWAWPGWVGRQGPFESNGFRALVYSMAISILTGFLLRAFGRTASGVMYRKEAMATVGLSWMLATLLGAMPYSFSGTGIGRDPAGTPIPMRIADCLFEAQSGFSTTGATVLTQIEDSQLVPNCILFWRSTTHFLGGLGIIVLFVAVLGQGSAGKALMRAEIPGPSKEGSQTRTQHAAWTFAGIYCLLTAVLVVLLKLESMSWFDAFCHAFGTMATGGFSTYNASIGHFDSPAIELTVLVFMILAGTNFTLLYFLLIGRPGRLLSDVEWRTYMGVIAAATALVVIQGLVHGDFRGEADGGWMRQLPDALRYGSFQVVSIMTTTGFATDDFDHWHSAGRGTLFLLMFVGGCAGSTGGGLKVIRHILFVKVLVLEVEQAFHPTVVRPLRLAGQPTDDPDLKKNILVYFALILLIFIASWMFLITVEPDRTWTVAGQPAENKLLDSASSVSATLNNIGPGLGIVGAKENYAKFTAPSKLLFTLLMMIGRLEIFVIVVLFMPSFWKQR